MSPTVQVSPTAVAIGLLGRNPGMLCTAWVSDTYSHISGGPFFSS